MSTIEEIPVFYKHCALTRELFILLVELHPSATSAGLAEQFKREYSLVGLTSGDGG